MQRRSLPLRVLLMNPWCLELLRSAAAQESAGKRALGVAGRASHPKRAASHAPIVAVPNPEGAFALDREAF